MLIDHILPLYDYRLASLLIFRMSIGHCWRSCERGMSASGSSHRRVPDPQRVRSHVLTCHLKGVSTLPILCFCHLSASVPEHVQLCMGKLDLHTVSCLK